MVESNVVPFNRLEIGLCQVDSGCYWLGVVAGLSMTSTQSWVSRPITDFCKKNSSISKSQK